MVCKILKMKCSTMHKYWFLSLLILGGLSCESKKTLKANDFSKISMEVGLLFWKSCYPELREPDYVGRLDYSYLFDIAKKKHETIKRIEKETFN